MKYVWHLSNLSWLAKQGSAVVMTIKAETGSSKNPRGEWGGSWMDRSLPAGNINRNIMRPMTLKCLSTDETACVPGSDKMHVPQFFSRLLLFQDLSVYFSSPVKRLGLTVQLCRGAEGGITERVTTPPTQSCSCTVFKMEKQSQSHRVGLWFHDGEHFFSFKRKSKCDYGLFCLI